MFGGGRGGECWEFGGLDASYGGGHWCCGEGTAEAVLGGKGSWAMLLELLADELVSNEGMAAVGW